MCLVNAVHLMYHVVVLLSVERFMGVFFEKRRTPLPIFWGTYLLCFIIYTFSCFVWHNESAVFFIAVFTFLAISMNYESPSMTRRFTAATFGYLGSTLVTSVMLIIAAPEATHGINLFGINKTEYESIYVYIATGLITYFSAVLLRKFTNIRKSAISSPAIMLSLAFIHFVSLAMLILALPYLPQVQSIIIIIAVLLCNLFGLYLFDRLSVTYEDKLKSAALLKEKEYYLAQCRLMQKSVEHTRSIRHDMKKHMAAIMGFAANINADEITDYLGSLLEDVYEGELYSQTGNIAFDSIINFKLSNVQDDDIKLDINLTVPATINIETADIIVIIGNLLDNALEAAAKVKDKMIKLNVEFNRNSLFVQVENTFDGLVEYKEEGGVNRIVSRKPGSENGYGLENIKRSIEKYNGKMDITHEGDVFSVTVLLYVDV